MKLDADKLAHIYVNARYILAQDDSDKAAVKTGKLFGAKRDCRTLEAIFPQLKGLMFLFNREKQRWDVYYGDDFSEQYSFTRPVAAVDHAEILVRDLFGESGVTPHDLPPEAVGVSFHLARFLLPPQRATCPRCGKIPLEK